MNHRHKKGRGNNLTYEDRREGGMHSAASQKRDEKGRFAGRYRLNEEEQLYM